MKYNRLGKTDMHVSQLGFGAWAIGGNEFGNSYGLTDDAISVEAIQVALDLGCTFIDTADVYGHGRSETLVGRALRATGKLHDVVIATKVGANFSSKPTTAMDFSRSHITQAIESSLRRLGREYLDLYQLHNPSIEIIHEGGVFDVLDTLKVSGKIRHYGVSIGTIEEGLACIDSEKPETLQIVYNLFSLINPGSSMAQLFPRAAQRDVGLIAREPLASGFLTGRHRVDTRYEPGDVRADLPDHVRRTYIALAESCRYLEGPRVSLTQAALRFVLDEPAIATVIVGIKTPEQVRENFAAAQVPCFEYLARG
jgi:aryl-alcohol dehydrogenase-like predicted oxidoreductase